MLWRSVGFLSVTLQRHNFLVLAGCAPGLAAQVEGRLGRPLSERLEFWRAAPPSAVDWGVPELDLPPPSREDDGAGAPTELLGAAGHLRAAGLRL